MKKLLLLSFVALCSLNIFSQDKGLGLGLVFGEPTGLSAKLWTSDRTALDAAVAWSLTGQWMHVQADLLMHNYDIFEVSEGALPLYYGLGAFLGLATELGLGARVPLGLDYQFEGAPVDIFAELAPGISLLPDIRFYLGGGIGVRYFF